MSQRITALALFAAAVSIVGDWVQPTDAAGLVLSGTSLHTCAILADHSLKCFGDTMNGRLGYGNTKKYGTEDEPMGAGLPKIDADMNKIVAACAGHDNTCALSDQGVMKCWGTGYQGQLGTGVQQSGWGGKPNQMGVDLPAVNLGATAKAIACGHSHNCAVLADGKAKCWGWGQEGQLGTGNSAHRGYSNDMGALLEPIDFGANVNIVEMAPGDVHTCARTDSGVVYCFGSNAGGRMAQGNSTVDLLPHVVMLPRPAKKIVASAGHTCALLDTGKVYCWGLNNKGQLGTGDFYGVGYAVPVTFVAANIGSGIVKDIAVGLEHTCVLFASGCVKCFGNGADGRLGYSSENDLHALGEAHECVAVGGPGNTANAIAAGHKHTCAVRRVDQKIVCWGSGKDEVDLPIGVLGRGDSRDRVGYAATDMPDRLVPVDLGAELRLDSDDVTQAPTPGNQNTGTAPTAATAASSDTAVLVSVAVIAGVLLGAVLAGGVFMLRRNKNDVELAAYRADHHKSIASVDAKWGPESQA